MTLYNQSNNPPQHGPGHSAATPRTLDNEGLDFSQYWSACLEYRYLIAICTALGLLLGVCYVLIATPLYTADALVQVEADQGASLPALEDISTLFEGEASIDAELQLITSRMVIGQAIDRLGLTIVTSPDYFPIFGKAIARRYDAADGKVSKPWFGLSSYAWGGEKLTLDLLELPASLEGQELKLIVEQEGKYSIYTEDAKLLTGRVGSLVQLKPAGNQEVSVDDLIQVHVSQLRARPGTSFTIKKLPLIDTIQSFATKVQAEEHGKNSGMIAVTMVHEHQNRVADYVNAIVDVYVSQNLDRNSAEAAQSLVFLEGQLPSLKEQLVTAENAYNKFRVENESIDLPTETQGVLEQLNTIGTSVVALQQERKDLLKRFKPAHPTVQALDGRIAILNEEVERLESQTNKLPSLQKEMLRLARDVEMNNILYSKLLNTSQELKVAKAGTVGNVRVIDYGFRPKTPVSPQKFKSVFLSTLLAVFLGVMLAITLRFLRGGVNDPDEIEKHLGLPVYASLIHSSEQDAMVQNHKKHPEQAIGILTALHPDSMTVESLRSLRTSLFFSLQQARNNVIMVAGAAPKIGKTFSSVNIAAILAESGKRVLVIDADLRRGTLHQYIGVYRQHGLSELIMDETLNPLAQLYDTNVPNLAALTTGELPVSPAELLLHKRFQRLLDIYSDVFDYVIIDAPPILAVTDAAIIGRSAGTTLMVIKANYHRMRELEQATKQFLQAGIDIKGVVFNGVREHLGRYGYGKYVYRYDYKNS